MSEVGSACGPLKFEHHPRQSAQRGQVLCRLRDEVRHIAFEALTEAVWMSEFEQTYGEGRASNLKALLLSLAARIHELEARGELLLHAGELTKLIGDVRSELFHYEVRSTYDTPEIADSRRIVNDAKSTGEFKWEKTDWKPEKDDDKE